MKSQPIFYCSQVNYPVGGYSGLSIFLYIVYCCLFLCFFLFFFAIPVFIITSSKEKTWSLEMQINITLLHISISHKIINKGLGDHLQITIIRAIRMDNWKLATLYQFILNYNQFILISQAHTSATCKSEMKIQPENS